MVADSLSAIKYAKVEPIRDEDGIIVDFRITGDFPKYGNDDDRVDDIARELVSKFMTAVRRHHTYRDGFPTTSVLTITSNVVYGKATGATPDGRKAGVPFAPGANPMHEEIPMEPWPPSLPWLSCPSWIPRMAFPIPSPSFRERWARRTPFLPATLTSTFPSTTRNNSWIRRIRIRGSTN